MFRHKVKAFDLPGACDTEHLYIFFFSVHRYGNSKEHMTVAELKMFLETEQKVKNVNCLFLFCFVFLLLILKRNFLLVNLCSMCDIFCGDIC